MRDTINDLYPGCGSDPLMGLDENEAARKEDAKLRVEFYKAPIEDYLPTNGGEIDKVETPQERIDELKALGCKVRQHKKYEDILIVEKSGRPHRREEVFVRIQRPGDRDLINERPAALEDKLRFARQWENYEKGASAGVVGTPLTEMPFVNTAMREELQYFGVVTGEGLVGMTHQNASKFPYMLTLKPMVQRYLDAKAADAPFVARDAKTAALEAKVAELEARLSNPPNGKNPPTKA